MPAFQIQEELVSAGGPKTKAWNNLAAIQLLKKLENANCQATPDEQVTLSQYVGWGGIPQIFESPARPEWEQLATQLQVLLSQEEYEAARASTLNAHFTSREVIKSIYQGLEHLGFQGGRILEPAVGVGNFLGLQPEAMRDRSKWTATELDRISCRIAQQLYPEASIRNVGFEKTALPDDSFDAVVTNVPFGDYSLHDPRYNNLNFRIHNYFIAKSLDLTRPGGLVVAITSTGTMQSQSGQAFREWIAKRANLVGAMRLPDSAFKNNALTEVTTDLLILQKLGGGVEPSREIWLGLANAGLIGKEGNPLLTNEYYVQHPENLLGIVKDDKLHPGRLALESDGRVLGDAIYEAFKRLPSGIYQELLQQNVEQKERLIQIPTELVDKVKLYGFVEHGGKLHNRVDEFYLENVEEELGPTRTERIRGMLQIRDAAQTVFNIQLDNGSDQDLAIAQQQLNRVYDSFVRKHGPINSVANRRVIVDDPDAPLLFALELYDSDTKTAKKADLFSKRVLQPYQSPNRADTAKESLLYSLNEKGQIDLSYMCQLTGQQEQEVVQELKGLIYLDPETKQWLPQDAYLSGNVRGKLQIARTAAELDSRFSENVEALIAVQPKNLLPGEIDVQLGSPWIETQDIQAFVGHLLEVPSEDPKTTNVTHSPHLAAWAVSADYSLQHCFANTNTYGTSRLSALELIEKALNLKDPRVYDYDQDKKAILNVTETEAAREKLQKIKQEFERWIWRDPDRCERLVAKYNNQYNNTRLREYDGRHLTFHGMSPHWEEKLHPHQRNAIWRCLESVEPVLLAHCVGAGKTAEMTGAAMEAKRLGLLGPNGKAMIVVPNHMLEQISGDFLKIYPGAKVLAITKDQLQTGKREALINRIATNNWDAVIITHKSFERIPLSTEAQLTFYRREAGRIEDAIGQTDSSNRSLVKRQESAKRRLEKRIQQAAENKDNTLTWEHLVKGGVRMVLLDEAHAYKNLAFQTQMDSISGLNPDGSDRAIDLLMKVRYLQEQGGKTVFATATPLANSIAEAYTWERYCGWDQPFDAWAANFTNPTTSAEIGPTGTYKMRTVLAEYKNLPELMMRFRQFADVRTAEQIKLPRPKVDYINVAVEASPEQLEYMDNLVQRAERIQRGGVDPRNDNSLKIFHEGREVMLHQQLRDPTLPDYPGNKLGVLADNVAQLWQETVNNQGTQLIFSDLGTPSKEGFSVYTYIRDRLLERGIPAHEIAFIHDYDSDAKKDKLFEDVRSGRVRVLLGSTEKMGCGTNVQNRCVAIHHADIPFRPCDREQRDGRALRPGNLNKQIEIYTYVTQGRGNNAGLEAYMAQLNERKAAFINKMMVGDLSVRRAELDSKEQMSFGELKAIASGNPLIQKKVEVDAVVNKLQRLQQAHENENYGVRLQLQQFPKQIESLQREVAGLATDLQALQDVSGDKFIIKIGQKTVTERTVAGEQLNAIASQMIKNRQFGRHSIGAFAGLELSMILHPGDKDVTVVLQGQHAYYTECRQTSMGTIYALEHQLRKLPENLEKREQELIATQQRYLGMRQNLGLASISFENVVELAAEAKSFPLPPFEHTDRLVRLREIQQEIDTALGLGVDVNGQQLNPDENYRLPEDLPILLNAASGTTKTEAPALGLDSRATDIITSQVQENSKPLEDGISSAQIKQSALTTGDQVELEKPQLGLATNIANLQQMVEAKERSDSQSLQLELPKSTLPESTATPVQLNLFDLAAIPQPIPPTSRHTEEVKSPALQQPIALNSVASVQQLLHLDNNHQRDSASQTQSASDLSHWQHAAQALGKSAAYLNRIAAVATDLQAGQPLLEQAKAAMQNDINTYKQTQSSLRSWEQAAIALGKSNNYTDRIREVTHRFNAIPPLPVSEQAKAAMWTDLNNYHNMQKSLISWEQAAIVLGRPNTYVARIKEVATAFSAAVNPSPLSSKAVVAMQQDLCSYYQMSDKNQSLQAL